MTKDEKWFRRLKRCMRDMPETVEIAVKTGSITLLPAGALVRTINEHGHLDNYADEYLDSLQHPRIGTCEESL